MAPQGAIINDKKALVTAQVVRAYCKANYEK